LIQFFNFATGCDEADDDSRGVPTAGGDADATIAERLTVFSLLFTL
jgi:hypothetical protein